MTTQTDFRYDDLPGLMTRMTGDEKHSTSATSTLDVMWVLYDRILRTDPRDPADPDRESVPASPTEVSCGSRFGPGCDSFARLAWSYELEPCAANRLSVKSHDLQSARRLAA